MTKQKKSDLGKPATRRDLFSAMSLIIGIIVVSAATDFIDIVLGIGFVLVAVYMKIILKD